MALSVEQLKTLELLATGSTVREAAQAIQMNPGTLYSWLRCNPEYVNELAIATDTFKNAYTKARVRDYRTISAKITQVILNKIDRGDLGDLSIKDLVKLLGSTVSTMKEEEAPIKGLPTSLTQNNIQINGISDKMNNPEFVKQFGQLLGDVDPEELQKVTEQKKKQDEHNNKY